MKITPEDREKIAEAYLSGESHVSIAKRYGISPCTVAWAARKAGAMPNRNGGKPELKARNERVAKEAEGRRKTIAGLYREGLRVQEISERLVISASAVYTALKREGIPLRDGRRIGNRNKGRKEREEIVKDYEAGSTVAAICARHGISPSRVYAYLKEAGTPLRQPGKSSRLK